MSEELARLKEATRVRINPRARAALQAHLEYVENLHRREQRTDSSLVSGGLRLLLEMYDAVVALE